MQIIDKRKALMIPPLLRLGFRPFFLLGSGLALLAIPLWILGLFGHLGSLQPSGGWLAWHRHELVFGFAGAIIAGFLLTAGQTWTGQAAPSGRPLLVLVLVWLAARLAWLPLVPGALLVLLNVGFFVLVALTLGRMLWAVRQTRNYPIVVVLLLLALADAVNLLGVWQANDAWQRQGALGAVWLVAALMGLIGGRVIPFFTQRGLGRVQQVAAWPKLDWALLLGSLLVAVLHVSGVALQASWLVAVVFLALGVGHAIRLVRWFDPGLLRVPLLWSLHLAYAWLAVACLGMALWHSGVALNPSLAVHALTVGAMGGLILAMIARVSLGHTGRPLAPPKGMTLAFILLNLACLSRVLLVLIWPYAALWLAGLCWTLGLGLYLWRYAPMLWRARVDGHPG